MTNDELALKVGRCRDALNDALKECYRRNLHLEVHARRAMPGLYHVDAQVYLPLETTEIAPADRGDPRGAIARALDGQP